jgi:competence protein ComEA
VRDLLGAWHRDARLGLAVLVAVAVIAGVVWYRIGVGGDEAPPRRVTAATAGQPAVGVVSSSTTAARDALVVHVAGAVATPGVVELSAGSRVIDALEAAGGAADDADLDRLNLAAKVADGQRVLVQRVGDPAVGATATGDGAGTPSGESTTAGGLVNVNTATQLELEALPGIGPALAAAIIDEREQRGGFRSVQELRDVRGIGEKRFAALSDLVSV